jgi:phosphotransferase system enzyme I (PtsI)
MRAANAELLMTVLKGASASPGVAVGPALVRKHEPVRTPGKPPASAEEESGRLDGALAQAREQLRCLADKIAKQAGAEEAEIFGAQALVLDDPLFIGQARAAIGRDRVSAEEAVRRTVGALVEEFERLRDARLRERAADISDIGKRLLANLSGAPAGEACGEEQGVLFAGDLTPSETASLDTQKVLAIVTAHGAATSHAAILARALNVPAVVAVKGVLERVKHGDTVVVDGGSGEVILHPGDRLLEWYRKRIGEESRRSAQARAQRHLPAITLDGFRVEVNANISKPSQADAALEAGADGVGLLRSEFLFLGRDELPSEDQQCEAYKEVLMRLAPRRVVIRTADFGGDKELGAIRLPREQNPSLGLRGIRLSLREEGLFATQLRALWRAARFGNLAVLLPMVSGVSEVCRTRELLRRIQKELSEAGEPLAAPFPLGVMVETPAAALMAEELARHADFFSIGTNDLTQYVLAVDRLSEEVAALYQPFHPAVLRAIAMVCKAARHAGKPAGVCGEMAADPLAVVLFAGMRVHELSANASAVPLMKWLIRSVRQSEAEQLVVKVLQMETAAQVVRRTEEFARRSVYADVFQNGDNR